MKKVLPIWLVAIFIFSSVGASILPSIVATDGQQNQIKTEIEDGLHTEKMTNTPYTGHLHVYVVEPVSRWKMNNQEPYHFGFLGFAFNEDISIDPQDTLHKSITWTGDVTETNAMVIAVVSNSEQHQGYANPPSKSPFWAYYTDATAAATPGNTGYNTVTTDFTHTVFVEEGTATWCPYCPAMANALNAIYEKGDYPFFFVAMVDDKNSQAASRLRSDYNIYGFPSAFFDGGYKVLVGGYSSESSYRPLIQASGRREVPPLNLSVSVTYIGDGDLQIEVDVTNGNDNLPPATPQAPSGETNGNVGVAYPYTTTTTDPNDYDIWYWFNWGDGTNSGWIGPRPSGALALANHTWTTKGTYNITVKAKDSSGAESPWSDPLPITMPYSYNKPILQFLELLFQRFPHAFPILRQMIGY
jgi:thiol-disulfide isomerase/thioredoxin